MSRKEQIMAGLRAPARALRRGYRRFTAWWEVPPHAATTAFLSLIALTAAGFFTLEAEGNKREEQFCNLINGRFNEHVRTYDQTLTFLESPAAQEQSAITDFVRANLPKQLTDLRVEADGIPDFCPHYADSGVPASDPEAAVPRAPGP